MIDYSHSKGICPRKKEFCFIIQYNFLVDFFSTSFALVRAISGFSQFYNDNILISYLSYNCSGHRERRSHNQFDFILNH